MNQTQFQKAAGISAGLAARWFPHIDAAMKEFGITSAIDQAMFIAQCGHESLGFNRVVENFNYSIAGLADFVRYGRLTQDQANSLGLKVDLVVQPQLLEQASYAARSAAWFYSSKGCLRYPGDLVRVTQIINGGQNGINDRRVRFLKAKSVLVV